MAVVLRELLRAAVVAGVAEALEEGIAGVLCSCSRFSVTRI